MRQDITSFGIYLGQLSPDCGEFQEGTRNDRFGEIFFETPITSHPDIWFSTRVGFMRHQVDLISEEEVKPTRLSDGSFVDGTVRNRYRASFLSAKISAGGVIEIEPGLRFGAAPWISFSGEASQEVTEEIIAPLGAFYVETNEDTRTVPEGNRVEFNRLRFGIDLSLGARLRLGKRLALHPELRGNIPFGSLASNVSWREMGYGAMIGLSFDLGNRSASQSPPIEEKPVVARLPYLGAKITARGIDAKGREYENPVIEIEEAPWTEYVPVIPYIFFDSASAAVPVRYVRLRGEGEAESYELDSLLAITPLDIHWQLLNIVGKKLRENPGKRVTITGAISNDEHGGEALGRERAASVARYLTEVWGIDPSRIGVAFAPASPTSSPEETQEGREENRRAEIRFNDEEIARPVKIQRMAAIASPPAVRFFPEIVADTTVAEWYITVIQGDKELLRFFGDSRRESLRQETQWSLGDLRVNRDLTPVRYRVYVRDVLGQEASAEGSFRVVERTTPRHADSLGRHVEMVEFSLVGFNYNSADLLPRHAMQLEEIAAAIGTDADLLITGFTDRVGDAERNRLLSLARARRVHEALKGIKGGRGEPMPQPIVRGLGGEREIFDNALPEGRLLSRMVRILINRRSAK